MKIFINILFLLIIFSCSDEKKYSSSEDLNLDVLDRIDKAWTLMYQESYEELEYNIMNLGKVCNSFPENDLHFDVFVACKALLFDFALGFLNDDEVYESDVLAIQEIFEEAKTITDLIISLDYTNETFYDFIEVLVDYLNKQLYLDNRIIDLNYIYECLDAISIDDLYFDARENQIISKIYRLEGNLNEAILYSKKSIDNYESYFDTNNWIILGEKNNLAELYFDIDNLAESRKILIEIISNTSFDEFPTQHLKSWDTLTSIEGYYGNFEQEFVYRKIFFQKYFYAIGVLGIWNSEIDDAYLEEFSINLDFLDCQASSKAIDEFYKIDEVRKSKYGDEYVVTFWIDIELQILKNKLNCSQNEKMFSNYQNQIISILASRVNEIFDPYELYQFSLFLIALDQENDEVYRLHLAFTKRIKEILDEIFIGINEGEYDNVFDQYLTDTVIFPLTFNLDLLKKYNPEILEESFYYIDIVLNYFLKNSYITTNSNAYKYLKKELTSHLIEKDFIQEALNYYEILNDFEAKKLSKIQSTNLIKDDNPLYESSILSNSYKYINECRNKNCGRSSKKIINKILNSVSSLDKDTISLALYLEKNNTNGILNIIKEEYETIDKKNKFLNQETNFEGTKTSFIEESIIKRINNIDNIDQTDIQKLYDFLYPKIELSEIQSNLNKNTLIISSTFLELRNSYFLLNIFISKNIFDLQIKKLDSSKNIVKKFYELNQISSSLRNLENTEEIKKMSKEISELIFGDMSYLIDDNENIFFTSNFHSQHNPNLLSFNDKWLLESHNLGYFLDWGNINKNNFKPHKEYIGFGNINYKDHEKKYVSLPETEEEIRNSSNNFLTSEIYFGDDANEKIINGLKNDNLIVHFATHNTNISKYGFNNIPALILSKKYDDGFIDAFEIQDIDFTNSDIILSACSTLYSNDNYESFSRLIRAFKISGSRSIMATRWDVESQSAVLISEKYTNNLGEGRTPYKAISDAQRSIIYSNEYSHPVFWAPYMTIVN